MFLRTKSVLRNKSFNISIWYFLCYTFKKFWSVAYSPENKMLLRETTFSLVPRMGFVKIWHSPLTKTQILPALVRTQGEPWKPLELQVFSKPAWHNHLFLIKSPLNHTSYVMSQKSCVTPNKVILWILKLNFLGDSKISVPNTK